MRCLHDEEATIKICIQPNLTFVTLTLPLSEYSPYSRCVVDRFAFLFVCQGQNTKYIAGQSAPPVSHNQVFPKCNFNTFTVLSHDDEL